MEYSTYRLSFQEKIGVLLKALGVTLVVAVLFYRSIWASLIAPIVMMIFWRRAKRSGVEEKKNQMQKEFVSGIQVLNSLLQAGLSMENAWKEVEKEMLLLYGQCSLLHQELKEINQRSAHNIPIEKLMLNMAYKWKIEDIMRFADLLEYGKRSGSNWKKIIDVFVVRITERYEAEMQMELVVAEKKVEQRIMNIMPLGMMAFLQFSAWDYMSVLYHNWFGCICMTIFLVLYLVAMWLSERILKVEI